MATERTVQAAGVIASCRFAVPDRSLPWLDPQPPWFAVASDAVCAGLPIVPADVPIVDLLSAPCTLAEVVAIRAGRFIPLFGDGPTRDEAVRALANIARALGAGADPRGSEHALSLAVHPAAGTAPVAEVARAVRKGSAATYCADIALAYAGVLGAGDAQRELLAGALSTVDGLREETALAAIVGGGDYSSYREHYALLTASEFAHAPAVRTAKAWFDFVLARRMGAFDTLAALGDDATLDPASRWLVTTAALLHGDEAARLHMAKFAEQSIVGLRTWLPRVPGVVAREMAEVVQHPLNLRFGHLRCAAARDHAAAAIRAWLTAATETEPEEQEIPGTALGPEPTRAGRSAIEARAAAGEFLLDWFVSDRDARETVDSFARRALRLYHRLRAATLLARAERELRPPGGMLTRVERVIWQPAVTR